MALQFKFDLSMAKMQRECLSNSSSSSSRPLLSFNLRNVLPYLSIERKCSQFQAPSVFTPTTSDFGRQQYFQSWLVKKKKTPVDQVYL